MPNPKDLLLIISKTSGSQVDPLPEFKKILDGHTISYDVKKLTTPPDIAKYLKKVASKYRDVAVYGGDGSIIAGIEALIGTSARFLLLPGGTANTIALELSLPGSATAVLKMYAEKRYITEYFDIAALNKEEPLTLDMHAGWWTEAIATTPRSLKKKFGPIAYGMSALKKLPAAKPNHYRMKVGKKNIRTKAYTMLVANHGFQGFLGVRLFPKPHRAGILQVALVKSISPVRIFIWLVGRMFGKNVGGAVKTYRARDVRIASAPKMFVVDDVERQFKLPLQITGSAFALKVIVAPPHPSKEFWPRLKLKAVVYAIRLKERFRNLASGKPSFRYSQITPQLYLGGTYRQSAYSTFKKWGVTGVVNMRRSVPKPPRQGFEILHLQTRDWTPPSLEDLAEGVKFIQEKVSQGGGVYVHCRQGEGRGPSMAAAYLISQGFTLEESLKIMKKSRPMARPNRSQVRQLARWQEEVSAASNQSRAK